MLLKNLLKAREPRIRFIKSLPPNAQVLDLGCGIGYNAGIISALHRDCSIYGVDLLPPESVASIMNYIQADLETAPFPYADSQFDAILCTHLLEHLRKPLRLGQEINRVLKPGGQIYIEAPNWTTLFVPSFSFHRDQHGPFNFFDDPTHLKPWSQHGLYVFISQSCQLKAEKIGSTRLWWRIPADMAIILTAMATGNRSHLLAAFVNLYGWCIYGIGSKSNN